MVHLLEGLQALARGEAAESLPREPVELGDVIDGAVHAARKRHPGVQYELAGRVDEGTVDGWEGGLRLLVDNLLDNAALHGRPQRQRRGRARARGRAARGAGRGRRPRHPARGSAGGCSSRSPAARTPGRTAPASGSRSSPSRRRSTAASCGWATPAAAGWGSRYGCRMPDLGAVMAAVRERYERVARRARPGLPAGGRLERPRRAGAPLRRPRARDGGRGAGHRGRLGLRHRRAVRAPGGADAPRRRWPATSATTSSPRFVELARAEHPDPRARFEVGSEVAEDVDYVLASGALNMRPGISDEDWEAHVQDQLRRLWAALAARARVQPAHPHRRAARRGALRRRPQGVGALELARARRCARGAEDGAAAARLHGARAP